MNPTSEPVAWGGVISAVAIAAIPFLRSVGLHITEDQSNSFLGLLAAVTLAGTFYVRSKVTPSNTAVPRSDAEAAVNEAMLAQPGDAKPVIK